MTEAIIELKSGRVERYDVQDLPHLRKGVGGMGYAYLNSKSGRYELARSIQILPEEVKQRVMTRSASISRKKREEPTEKLPTHLRNHLIYGV